MKTYEKIKEMKGKLIKVIMDANSRNEEAILKLEEFGLDKEFATELLRAYTRADQAKQTAKNVWNTAWESHSGVDFSTDIGKAQEKESSTREYFDDINFECALIMVANTVEASEIDDHLLEELYVKSIQEHQIKNPALKITYHYYNESREKDYQIAEERANGRQKVSIEQNIAKKEIASLNSQLQILRGRYATLNDKYNVLQSNSRKRLEDAEQLYQKARAEISTLKGKIEQLQNRGVFKTIGDKLTRLFGNKRKELPEATTSIPNSIYENSAEKMGVLIPGEDELETSYIEKHDTRTTTVNRTDKDDWQL